MPLTKPGSPNLGRLSRGFPIFVRGDKRKEEYANATALIEA